MDVLVDTRNLIGLGPLILDIEQQIDRPDEKRQDQQPRGKILQFVPFEYAHPMHRQGLSPASGTVDSTHFGISSSR